MVIAAISNRKRIKASDVEFDMPVPSYSIDTLNVLSKMYPEHTFTLLIGSDNALVFDKWKDYPEILEKYSVLVYPRRGYDFETVAQHFPQMKLLPTPFYDISSTEIRSAFAQNQPVDEWLEPEVIAFIQDNELYEE
jgi:nicotinate-nucleotide adenylyltransferase